jgi:DNA-binding LytR/AlgR family response regulator
MKARPVKCLIVDDEPLAREIIQTYLKKIEGWELSGLCINAIEAYQSLHNVQPDVIFLDIRMPSITGTELLRSLKKPPLVVFTTAYSNYAVEGFELNAIDYLLKPITFVRFLQAIEKLREKLSFPHINEPIREENDPSYIFIKLDSKLVKIEFDNLLFIKAERDFSSVFLKDKKLFASMHLKMFEDLLPHKHFIRVHRSYMVNISKIMSLYGNVLEIDGKEIPIGTNYKEQLIERLNIGAS